MSPPYIVAHTAKVSVLLVYFVLTGCHSSSRNLAPTVAFSKVAAAYQAVNLRINSPSQSANHDVAQTPIYSLVDTGAESSMVLLTDCGRVTGKPEVMPRASKPPGVDC